jgi:1,4-dihydroxy-6-naphthoate synthase
MRLRCAISPDADDLFMFRAILLGLIDTEGLEFVTDTDDTHGLNMSARSERSALDLSAMSIAAYPSLAKDWQLLPHSGSVGRDYGPVLIAREAIDPGKLEGLRVGTPGPSTTAHTILRLHSPEFQAITVPITPPEAVFERLEAGELDAALLIHEGRLVYEAKGFVLILDIGEWWSRHTGGLPLPLGGMVIRRSLGSEVIDKASRVVHRSVAHALANRKEAIAWLLERGSGPLCSYQEVDHYLSLYANADSLDYGHDGRAAINELLKQGAEAGLLPPCTPPDLVHQSSNS